jgi:UDP-GlcNAc:undecaprenyl-phosphate/decaprenyl-phosphate GlcNAc-1-phosphate transferase
MSAESIIIIMVTTIVIAVWGNRWFQYLWLLDRPGADQPKRDRVPNYQWVFVLVAMLMASVLVPWAWDTSIGQALMIGTIVLWWFALINDVIDRYTDMQWLSPMFRLTVQLAVIAGVVMYSGVWVGLTIAHVELPLIVGIGFAVVWIFGFMNAMNWFDGVYGFAGGNAAIGYLTTILLIQYLILPNYQFVSSDALLALRMVSQISIIMLIISIVFTVMEYKPWGLVRDIGVIVYGFTLGYMALIGGAKIGMVMAVLSPMILDSIWVVIHRVFWMRKSPVQWDYTHLHHRLLTLGWTRSEIRIVVWSRSLIMMVLMLLQWTNSINKVIIFGMFAVAFFAVHIYLYWYKKLPYEFKKEKKPMDMVESENKKVTLKDSIMH